MFYLKAATEAIFIFFSLPLRIEEWMSDTDKVAAILANKRITISGKNADCDKGVPAGFLAGAKFKIED